MPKLRGQLAPHVRDLIRTAFSRPLLIVYALVVLVSSASTALAWRIGIWDWGLTKDAVIITATVVLPMTIRSFSFKSGGGLALHLIRETIGLAALLTFYLDSTPLPLIGELVVQPIVTFVVILQAVARSDPEYASARRACDVFLIMISIFLIVWSTVTLFSGSPNWWELVRSLLFNFWLPLSLLPFFYVFGFYALTDKVRARFRAIQRPFTPPLMLAFMVGTRLRISLLARRYRDEAARLSALNQNAGRGGVDDEGLHIDRRGFDVTKKRLDWIWTCQNGQWDRQGGRYWDHMTDIIVDAEKHGLPADHGFEVQIADAGLVWRAWRKTPGGAVLGVGGRERRSMYYFQGDAPPSTWPAEAVEWVDTARAQWPPDWDKNDGTRL